MPRDTLDNFIDTYAGKRAVKVFALDGKADLDPWVIVHYADCTAIIELKAMTVERHGADVPYLDLDVFSFAGEDENGEKPAIEAESFGMTAGESRADEYGRIHGKTTAVLIGPSWTRGGE